MDTQVTTTAETKILWMETHFFKSTIFNLMWYLTNTTHMVSDAEKVVRPDSLSHFLSVSLFLSGNLVYFIKVFFPLSLIFSLGWSVLPQQTPTLKKVNHFSHKHTHTREQDWSEDLIPFPHIAVSPIDLAFHTKTHNTRFT